MKYEEIYLINERLTAVTDSLMQKKLPMKLTLPLTDNMRQISAAMSDWRERYTTLLERYAKGGERLLRRSPGVSGGIHRRSELPDGLRVKGIHRQSVQNPEIAVGLRRLPV